MRGKQQGTTSLAVAYARVSSKEQEKEGYSIPAQQRLLRDYAAEKGMTILQEFVDVETAKKAGREGFDEMVRFLKMTPACRVLLVEKTDRLYRNFKDYVTLDDLDLEIHLIKENQVLSKDSRSSEKFVHGIKVLMAKNYIDNLSEETRKGMSEKAAEGIWPSRCPLGYRNVARADGKKVIEPDPEVAPLIVKLFEWYATGNYSLHQVARMAREAGLVYRKSKRPVSRAAIHAILRSRIYTGKFTWKGKVYQGIHRPLITEELWERVQAILSRRSEKKHRKAKHDFAFSRLITCGHCGCALVGEIKKGKYVYYHCTGFKGKCPEPFTREEVLEGRFTEVLRGLVLDEEVIAFAAEALRQSHQDARRFHDDAVARLQAEYTRIQGRIDAMYIDKLDRVIDAAFFERKSAEWRDEQQALLRQIAQHQQANQTYLEEGIQLLELARRAPELFARQQPREKRRLLDFVLSNCTWRGGELAVTYRQPFDLLAVMKEGVTKKEAAGVGPGGLRPEWLPDQDSNLEQTG
jgi:site-specific DNA recombinase